MPSLRPASASNPPPRSLLMERARAVSLSLGQSECSRCAGATTGLDTWGCCGEGSAPEFEFVLLDGEVLERSGGGGAFSYENSRLDSVPLSQERVGVADEVVRDATLALRSLGLKAREAGAQVQAALTSGGGGPCTASELVRAVLRAS